ncbi:hypothetical protein Tco_1050993 [Tanacetum coccineum]
MFCENDETEVDSINFFDTKSLQSLNDEKWDPFNMDDNGNASSDDCLETVEDEVVTIATQIGDNVISESNNQNISNGEGTNIHGNKPRTKLRRSTRKSNLPLKFNDFVVNSNVKYSLKKHSKNDYSLYVKSRKGLFIALLVYFDDIAITSFVKHLEENHVTWAQFEKKLDKNTTFQADDFHHDAFTKCA